MEIFLSTKELEVLQSDQDFRIIISWIDPQSQVGNSFEWTFETFHKK